MAEAELKENSNGHKEIPPEVQNLLGLDVFKGAFTTQQVSSAIEKFIERGEKIEDLIMRGHFWDIDHMNAWVRLLRKSIHFGDKELEQMLMNHLAGCTSVNGERIDVLLRAVIGQYHSEKYKNSGANKLKGWLGLNNNDNK